ncbi:MAG: hypothetical protein AAF502_22370 [Bacteroidota bacterium]
MSKQITDDDLIELFLIGQLSEQQSSIFEARKKDPDFQKRFNFLSDVSKAVESRVADEMKAILKEEERKIEAKGNNIIWLFVIAAAVIIIVFGTRFLLPSNDTPPDHFADHFVPVENLIEVSNRETIDSAFANSVYSNYEEKKYEEALAGFDSLLKADNNPLFRFYKANTQLALGDIDAALVELNSILQVDNFDLVDETKWLLALSYLRKENFTAAKPLLIDLESSTLFKTRVDKILEDTRLKQE